MRILVEHDFYGIKPDETEHELLRHAMQIQLDRHNKQVVNIPDLAHDRFVRYLAGGYERPRDGYGMEWTTIQPLIGALCHMSLQQMCTFDESLRANDMIEELFTAGCKYIEDYLDAILAQHLDSEVDVTYITSD